MKKFILTIVLLSNFSFAQNWIQTEKKDIGNKVSQNLFLVSLLCSLFTSFIQFRLSFFLVIKHHSILKSLHNANNELCNFGREVR